MPNFWNDEFSITSVTRQDLITSGIPRRKVKELTDEQMRRIASKMADYYCTDGFWDDVRAAMEYVLEQDKLPTGGAH
jgi:hypothetical protein